jgi:anaerobic magnesium-protoporphyrin IX monomethyl ester cyclase
LKLQNIKRNVLLVNPPFYRLYKDTYSNVRYPLSLGYLGATISKETNWSITVYNADFAINSEARQVSYLAGEGFKNFIDKLGNLSSPIWEEVKSTMENLKPAVVGIYSSVATWDSACIVAKLAKQINKKILTVLGGPYPTTVGADALRDQNIDVAVIGEGERTIIDLLNAIDNKESFDKVKGIIYKSNDQTVKTEKRDLIQDLDTLCFPYDYAPKILKDYKRHPKSAFKYILATRGCPYDCFFCGSRCVWGTKVRFRSVSNVAKELKSIMKNGVRQIEFVDDTFGTSKEYTHQLCDSMIRNCKGLRWSCETRVDLIDEATLLHMKKAGCHSIYIGIESGNNQILKEMRKNITIEQALAAAQIIRKQCIQLTAFFMIGTPWETEATLSDSFNAMKKIDGLITYSIFTPYPGTEAFEYCRQEKLIDEKYETGLYNHQSPENCFCMNIPKERFRELASEIEAYVDKRNARFFLRNILTANTLREIRGYGVYWSFKVLKDIISASW